MFPWSEAADKHLHTNCGVTQTPDVRCPKEFRCNLAWHLAGGGAGEVVHRGHGSVQQLVRVKSDTPQ